MKTKLAATGGAPAQTFVDDVFSTYLYTGNGSTQTITNGIDLAGKGGMTWIKSRSAATDHKLTDTTRGATKALISDTTGAETTDTTGLTAFSSTGFSLGASSVYNTNAATYASWTFREAAKFFDIVSYTGDGDSSRRIAHSLNIEPGLIIIKKTSNSGNWFVGARTGLSTTGNWYGQIYLNTTAMAVHPSYKFGDGANTDFAVGGAFTNDTNFSGQTYVAYLFAHDTSSTGIIQCGSYTGNGSATGPTVSLGWEPQYLMVKNASGTGNWQILDSMRGMPVGSADATLQANLSNAESSVEYLSPTATGFQITSTSTEVNTSGSTYIYMAIRRPNKPPTSGTQVFFPTLNGVIGDSDWTGYPLSEKSVDVILARSKTGTTTGFIFSDRLRGIGQTVTANITRTLDSATTTAETTTATYPYQMGDTVGAIQTVNVASPISYLFKRAPGFFDVVCYTGNGVSGTSISHNLTVAPELIVIKSRGALSVANGWPVWNSSFTGGQTIWLNLTLNRDVFPGNFTTSGAQPTSTTFNIGNNSDVNYSLDKYVAYLFATLAGISKVGSYTGNGTGQAIACGFSAGARFVLIKRTDAAGAWYTFDSARGLTSGSSPYLLLNSTAAETTGNNGVYASTGGFTLGATAITTTNIATATYIFLAVA